MNLLHIFFTGMFIAGVLMGSWWLALTSGLLALLLKRTYVVLLAGVILDLWFATVGDSFFYIGFYTVTFTVATVVIERVRSRLFWAS